MQEKSKTIKHVLKKTKKFFVSLYSGWRATTMLATSIAIVFLTLALSITLTGPAQVATYVFFAITLIFAAWLISFLVYHKQKIKEAIETEANKHELTKNLLEMYGFKILVLEVITFAINIAYAFFLSIISITNRSIWYGSLSIFYFLLMLIRLVLLVNQHGSAKKYSVVKLWTTYEVEEEAERATKRSKTQELKTYRVIGGLMLFLTIILSVSIVQRVVSGGPTTYSSLMIYMTAAYTFYKIIISSLRFARNRKHTNYYIQCFQNINLVDAGVSVFALQAALLRQFGGGQDYFVSNAIVGILICAFIIAIGLIMIIKGSLAINKLTQSKEKSEKNNV